MSKAKKCINCGEEVKGRSDKKFCDDQCRSQYNNKLNSDASMVVREINATLRKNRRVLEELVPANEGKIKIHSKRLAEKGYNFSYHTHTYKTKNGNVYFFCYEFGYLPLENDYYMLVKRQSE